MSWSLTLFPGICLRCSKYSLTPRVCLAPIKGYIVGGWLAFSNSARGLTVCCLQLLGTVSSSANHLAFCADI